MAGQSLRTERLQGGTPAAQEPIMGAMRPPQVPPPANHGRTLAAWSVTVIVVAGFTVAGLGMIFALLWLFWAGLALAVIGVIVGVVLRAAGFGQGGSHTSAAPHH